MAKAVFTSGRYFERSGDLDGEGQMTDDGGQMSEDGGRVTGDGNQGGRQLKANEAGSESCLNRVERQYIIVVHRPAERDNQ